jgi:hypothetical protein
LVIPAFWPGWYEDISAFFVSVNLIEFLPKSIKSKEKDPRAGLLALIQTVVTPTFFCFHQPTASGMMKVSA